MPDNISLSVSDINDLKSQGNLIKSIINAKNFIFDAKGATAQKKLALVGSDSSGIKVFAITQTAKMTSSSLKVSIPLKNMASKATPCVLVTLSGDTTLSKYKLTVATHITKNSVDVYIESGGTKKITTNDALTVDINLLAIGYA